MIFVKKFRQPQFFGQNFTQNNTYIAIVLNLGENCMLKFTNCVVKHHTMYVKIAHYLGKIYTRYVKF